MKLSGRKTVRIFFRILLYLFALIGFGLTAAFFAIRLGLTNDPGAVDYNHRYFNGLSYDPSYNKKYCGTDSLYQKQKDETFFYYRLMVLNEFYPRNACLILKAYKKTDNLPACERMLDVISSDLRMKDNWDYQHKLEENKILFRTGLHKPDSANIFEWMNMDEWEVFRQALAKDKKVIDSVEKVTGVEARMIASVLVGEQIRMFNSNRESYKRALAPLKILSLETNISLGVTGIKDFTAAAIEHNLKDTASEYYPGPEYEHLLDFQTGDIIGERFRRLTCYNNHFYSYLYAALFIRQVAVQWKRAGYDISGRPEILATLFNVGFWMSKPKRDPAVGGSRSRINGREYTFGTLAYEFYYSGEMIEEFPFRENIIEL